MALFEELQKIGFMVSPFANYTPNNESEKLMSDCLDSIMNKTDELLSLKGSPSWLAGQAFQGILEKHTKLNDTHKKLCIASCVYLYIEALAMGTMQSVMAMQNLAKLLQNYRDVTDIYFAAMPDAYMMEKFNMPLSLLEGSNLPYKETIDYRFTSLIALFSALLDNKTENSMNKKELRGTYYILALKTEAQHRIKGYGSFGMIP